MQVFDNRIIHLVTFESNDVCVTINYLSKGDNIEEYNIVSAQAGGGAAQKVYRAVI